MKNNRTYTKLERLFVLAVLLFLAGCTSKSPAPVSDRGGQYSATKGTYVVKAGDTVRSIAREFGMDYRELIAINSIESPARIAPGRVLVLSQHHSGSFDSRYFGLVPLAALRPVEPVLTF